MLKKVSFSIFLCAFLFAPAGYAVESSSPHPKEFLIESFPEGLTLLDEINGEYILRLGKCCDQYGHKNGNWFELHRYDSGEIALRRNAGGEADTYHIKEYTLTGTVHKLHIQYYRKPLC